MTPLVSKALGFAFEAHGQTLRRFGGGLVVQHPVRVALAVAARGYSDEVVAAALLHDVVEDCDGVTIWAIEGAFGLGVASLVDQLTDKYTHRAYPDLNRAARKALEGKRPKTAAAIAVKLADVADNLATWDAADSFAEGYLAEKVEWLDAAARDPRCDAVLLAAALGAAEGLRKRVGALKKTTRA